MTHTDTHTFHMIIFGFGPCPSNVLLYGCLYKQTSCMFCTHKSQQQQNLQINGLPRKFSSQFLLFSHTPWAKTPSNWNTVETEQISNMYRSRRTNERTNKRFIELGRLPMSNREVGGLGGHFMCINNLSIKTFQQTFSPYTHTHTHARIRTHAFTQTRAHSHMRAPILASADNFFYFFIHTRVPLEAQKWETKVNSNTKAYGSQYPIKLGSRC